MAPTVTGSLDFIDYVTADSTSRMMVYKNIW